MRGEISKAVKKAFERLPQFAETEAFGALRGGLLFNGRPLLRLRVSFSSRKPK